MSAYVRLLPVLGLPEVEPGDDLGALLAARADLADGDVVVVAQKVVSKAEGRLAEPAAGEAPADARRRLARAEARRVVADTPWVLITETPHGFVCANGGVDASNVRGGRLALLPEDADASARRLRARLAEATGLVVGVVVADTFGRPWRLGQTDVAIGVAGLAPVRDERGSADREGVVLEVTEAALADELAAAADLVRRKADGVPAVVARGLDVVTLDDGPGAAALVRPAGEDLFRRGAGQLARELSPVDAVPSGAVPAWLVERALEAGRGVATVHRLDDAPLHRLDDAPLRRLDDAPLRRLDDAPLRLAVDGEAVAAGVAAGLVIAALVDGGAAALHRQPRGDEPGVVVVEAGWEARR